MKKEWRVKTFKSGNSLAIRIPKSAGFAEGDEVVVVPHEDGSYSMWKESNAKNVLMSLYGSMSPGFMKHGRGDIEQGEREWESPASAEAA